MKFKLFKLSLVLGLGLLSSSAWAQATVQAPNALGNAGAWNSSTQIIVCQQSGGCDLTGSKPLQLGTGAQLSAFVNSALPPINLAVGGGGGVTGLLPASNLATGVAASNLGFTPLNPANNLSDLASVTTARTNLGLGSLALLSTPLPYADLPALSANQLLGALTDVTTPSGLSVPSCSGSTNALIWVSGIGFACNTIPGGGTGTVTNITTSAPLFGGPIATTGTISLNGPSDLTTFTAGTVPMGAGTSSFVASEITDVASGGVTVGSPTGGQKGAGTINMTGCFINNVPCAAGSSTAFSAITGGTNASAAMVVGTGASLGVSGTGTIAATSMPASGLTGTVAAANMLPLATNDVYLGNGSAQPAASTLSAAIDAAIGSTQGDILYRGVSTWAVLGPGTSGQFLETLGAAANPAWATASGSGTVGSCSTADALAYYAATGTVTSCLAGVGTSGQVLTSNGTGVAPTFQAVPATTITLAPGLAATPTSYNTGTQTVTNGSTVSPQLFYEGHATSYTVLSTDGAKLLTATAASVIFTAPNPGSVGTTTYQFGYDASHSYTITTVGGTASIYGCGTTGTSETLTYPAQIITDGTNYQCVPSGSTGGGSGTVTSVGLTVPGSSILGVTGSPVTTSGNLGLTTTGASGGIPYFSSTSALSSSALLAAGNLMVGGGAGTAPATNPDWSFSSNVLVGNFNSTAVPSPATLVSNGAIIAGADGTNSGLGLIGTNGAQGVIQDIAYGGTLASPTALGTSVNIGALDANGYDGTSVTTTAPVAIQFQTCSGAAWVHGTNTCGIIAFNTTASGSVTPGTNAALRSDGSFIVAASAGAVTSPGAHGLYVSGPTSLEQVYSASSALTDATSLATNAALSNNFTITLTTNGPYTLANPTNLASGQALNYTITEDATGGRTIGTYGTEFNFPGGTPILNTAANAINNISCLAKDATHLNCYGGVASGAQLLGTTTNNNATAGNVGEEMTSSVVVGSAVSLTTATPANVTSLSLTAGDWDVCGATVLFNAGSSTVTTSEIAGINTTSATLPTAPAGGYTVDQGISITGNTLPSLTLGCQRESLASTTTVYLVAQAAFTVSTNSAYGKLRARRVR